MKDIFFDLSVRSVRFNFLRSLLASIGIVIGVVAISSMGMLGTNMQLSVKDQLLSNVNTVMITSDTERTSSSAGVPTRSQGIDKSQLNDIKSSAVPNIVVPLHRTSTQFTIGSTDGRSGVSGIDPNDFQKFPTIDQGDNVKGANDVLVGPIIATNFNLNVRTRIKIGQPGTQDRPTVGVSGILAARGFASDGVNADNAIIASDTWYTSHYGDKDVYDQVNGS